MKSSIFKRSLLASMASLTALSTFSGSVSTKIYATEPEMQESIDDHIQEDFATCSCGGVNFIVRCYEDDSTKETRDEFLKKFKEIMAPYDEKMPEWKEITCTFIGFNRVMKKFLSIEKPEDQRKYFEDCYIYPQIRNYMASMVTCSCRGYNFVFNSDELIKKGLDKELVDQFVEKFKGLMKNNPYNENLPKNKVISFEFQNIPKFREIIKNFLSITFPEDQAKFLDEILKLVIRENLKIEADKLVARFSYGRCNLTFNFNELVENESDRETVIQFVKKMKDYTKPYDRRRPEREEFAFECKRGAKILGVMKKFPLMNSEGQQKFLASYLENAVKDATREESLLLIKYSYKGYNFADLYDMKFLNEEEKEMLMQFAEKFKELVDPYDESKSKNNEFGIAWQIDDEFKKMIENFVSGSPECQKRIVGDILNFVMKKILKF